MVITEMDKGEEKLLAVAVLSLHPRRRRLAGSKPALKARGCRSHKMVMAHGLPARVGENVSDEWL